MILQIEEYTIKGSVEEIIKFIKWYEESHKVIQIDNYDIYKRFFKEKENE